MEYELREKESMYRKKEVLPMKTAVMTDSNSGIMKAEAESMGIFLISIRCV